MSPLFLLTPRPVAGGREKSEAVRLGGECKGGDAALGRGHLGIAIFLASPAATLNICCATRSCQHTLSATLFPLPKPFRPATRLEC